MAETMNFFRAQDEARGRTRRLVALLILSVVVLAGSLYVIAVAVLGGGLAGPRVDWAQPRLFLGTSGVALAVILGGSLVRMAELAKGGSAVAESLGGRLVNPSSSDPDEKRYLNVVQEMALASGLPVPLCYVVEGDETINAFAAGNSPQDAAVAVTRGALRHLARDELQGVVAHEFSHIGNGDMRLNLRIIGTVAGLTALAQLGYILIRLGLSSGSGSERRSSPWPLAVAGLVVVTIGLGGVFFARLIQASVSRQREYLADASAVQFTRNPVSFADALRKVAGYSTRSREASAAELESQHLFFASSGGFLEFLFSTHPPIEERIRRVDPSGASIRRTPRAIAAAPDAGQGLAAGFAARSAAPSPSLPADTATPPPLPASCPPPPGAPTDLQIQRALGFSGTLPGTLREASGDPVGAMGVVLGLLLRSDPALRSAQLEKASGLAGGEVAKGAVQIEPALRALPPGSRVPLLDLCMPALRQLSPGQQSAFGEAIERVGYEADDGLVVLLIQAMMRRQLAVEPSRSAWQGDVAQACSLVLSAVVQTSGEDAIAQGRAYVRGCSALGMDGLGEVMVESSQVDLASVEAALAAIYAQGVPTRRRFVRACGVAMLSDGMAEPAEVEIVRAVAESLGMVISPS